MIFKNGLKSEYITPQICFMDIERSKINYHALKRHLLIRTGQSGATFLTPSLTRQDFRSPCDVELAGEDCTYIYIQVCIIGHKRELTF